MSEETTQNFNGEGSFETRVLSELAALRDVMTALENRVTLKFNSVETRLTSIEGRVASVELKVDALDEKVDARLRDARPLRESVLSRLETIDEKFASTRTTCLSCAPG